jgi:hypothetical protein
MWTETCKGFKTALRSMLFEKLGNNKLQKWMYDYLKNIKIVKVANL